MVKIRTMSLYVEGYDWRRASFAGIGKHVVGDLLFSPKEKLFQVGFGSACFRRTTDSIILIIGYPQRDNCMNRI